MHQTSYFPYGLPMHGLSSNPQYNRLMYNGNELQTDHALNIYDFNARQQDPQTGRFWAIDPLAESYASISPYAFCAGDPINSADPTGCYIQPVIYDNDILDQRGTGGGGYGTTNYRIANFNAGPSNAQINSYLEAKSSNYAPFQGTLSQYIALMSGSLGGTKFYGAQAVEYLVYGNVATVKVDGVIAGEFEDGTPATVGGTSLSSANQQGSLGSDFDNWGANFWTMVTLYANWLVGDNQSFTFKNDATANSFRNAAGIVKARDEYYTIVKLMETLVLVYKDYFWKVDLTQLNNL